MNHFSYSICLTLLHSLWQAALLLLLFSILQIFSPRQQPAYKKNFLFLLIVSQLILSVITCCFYLSGTETLSGSILQPGITPERGIAILLEQSTPYCFLLYCFMVCGRCARILISWYSFKKNYHQDTVKPSPDLKVFTTVKAMEFGIRRKVTLWYSNTVNTPLTFGFFKPVILMPVALVNRLTIKEAESLIIHELTHIRNNDYLLNWMMIIVNNIYFFNPFIGIICRKIKLERELSCDVQVLYFDYPGVAYAETLLKAAKGKTSAGPFQLAAVLKNNELLKRILFFTTEHNMHFNKRKHTAVTGFGLFIVSCICLLATLKFKMLPAENNIQPVTSIVTTPGSPTPERLAVKTTFLPAAAPGALFIRLKEPAPVSPVNSSKEKRPTDFAKATNIIDAEFPEVSSLEENYSIPVAALEPDYSKEVIVKEENSATGEITTKAFRMTFKDGQWTPQLLWIMTESKPSTDTLRLLPVSPDRWIPAVQSFFY